MASGDTSNLSWDSLKGMPTKRVFSTPVALEDTLYVVGGCDQMGIPLDTFESYNPKNGRWNRLLQMPTRRAGPCVVTLDRKIVVLGGVSANQEPLDAVEYYDTDTKSWKKGDSMREKLMGLSGIVREGRIYVVGGMGADTNPKDYFMGFDVENNRWQSLSQMPTPRYATFSFLINDKLYVLGGRQGKTPVAAIEVYDFGEGKWRKLPDIPSKRVFAVYTHSDTHIFSLGGLHQNPKDGFSDTLEIYDIEKETWTAGKPMLNKRGDFAAGFIGGKVIAAGGLGNMGKPLAASEAYDLDTDTWTALPEMPAAHCSCAFTTFKDKLHVVGGLSLGGPTGAMEVLACK